MSSLAAPLAAAAASLVAAVLAQRASHKARVELHALVADRPDPGSTVLLPSALSLRLEPELGWAAVKDVRVGIAVFRFLGAHPDRAARALRDNMRGGENAYQLRSNEFAVAFWDSDHAGTGQAVSRLGRVLESTEAEIVEVGYAVFPHDGDSYLQLIECARDRRTVLDFLATDLPARSVDTRVPSWWRSVSSAMPSVGLAALCLAVVSAGAHAWHERGAASTDVVQVAAIGSTAIALGTAAYFASSLAFRSDRHSFPVARRDQLASPRWCAAYGGLVAASALWAMDAFASVGLGAPAVGATVLGLALVTLLLASARTLVHAPFGVLTALVALGVGVVALLAEDHGELANAGRLLVAVGAGSAIARGLERWSWSITLVVMAAVLDAWSVWATNGITRNLGSAAASVGDAHHGKLTLDSLLYVGPTIDGSPAFHIGTSDLVIALACIATAHYWRLGERRVTAAMLAAFVVACIWARQSEALVPALPVIAMAYLLSVGVGRWRVRSRAREV